MDFTDEELLELTGAFCCTDGATEEQEKLHDEIYKKLKDELNRRGVQHQFE